MKHTPDKNSGDQKPIDAKSAAALRKIKDDFARFAEEKEREYLPQMLDKFAAQLPEEIVLIHDKLEFAKEYENKENKLKINKAENLLRIITAKSKEFLELFRSKQLPILKDNENSTSYSDQPKNDTRLLSELNSDIYYIKELLNEVDKYDVYFRDKLAMKLKATYVGQFDVESGLARTEINNRWYLINRRGEKLNLKDFPNGFLEASPLMEGFYCIKSEDIIHEAKRRDLTKEMGLGRFIKFETYYFIDQGGNLLERGDFKNGFKDALPFSDGLVRIKKDDLYYFVNKDGRLLDQGVFSRGVQGAKSFSEGLTLIQIDSNTSYITDKNGQFLFTDDFKDGFTSAETFNEGAAPVKIRGKFYFINKQGKIIERGEFGKGFERAQGFREGVARVLRDNNWHFINQKGEFLKDEDFVEGYDNNSSYSEGLAMVKLGRNWHFIDKEGKYPKQKYLGSWYSDTTSFKEGVANVKKGSQPFYIDHAGRPVFWSPDREFLDANYLIREEYEDTRQ